MDVRRAQLIWDGVALNSTPSIALYKEAEIALATLGIGLDWGGFGYEALTDAEVAAIVETFPRLGMKERFTQAVCHIVETRPTTTYDNFARDFGERFVPGYKPASTVDYLLNSPFNEDAVSRLGDKKEKLIMKNKTLMVVLLFLMPGTSKAQHPAASGQAPHAAVTSLTSKDLPEFPGKEALMILVDYPPGAVDPIHRHNAHAFIYVLEGSIIMQVKGGKEVTLTPGQTFYEGPNDIHVVGRNASTTKPAKFVVFFVKDKGAPVLVLAPE